MKAAERLRRAALALAGAGIVLPATVGCTRAQVENAISPGVTFAICVINTYDHEAAGVPIVQVVADEIAACGGDAVSIISVLDAHESKAKHAHVAHEKVVSP